MVLAGDLDLADSDFKSIPTFGGTFDGGGHTISGLTFDGDGSNEGFFRYVQELSLIHISVIIGRCADYILRERTDAKVLSVFVSAPMDACIRRKMEQKGITEKEAEALIKKVNKDRRKYYEFHTGKDWSAPDSYDIYLDSSRQSMEEMTEVLVKRFNEL